MPATRRPGLVPVPRPLRRSRHGGASGAVAPEQTAVIDVAAAIDPVGTPAEPIAPDPVDASFALTRPHVDGLLKAMIANDVSGPGGTATPDRLRSAIETALGEDRGTGTVLVTRLPRALHSSESWHVRLGGVTPAGRDRIAAVVATVRLATRTPAPTGGGSDVR